MRKRDFFYSACFHFQSVNWTLRPSCSFQKLFWKFSQKLILKTGFLKNTAEDLMPGRGCTAPHHRGSPYPISLKLSSQIPPHLPPFSVFLKFSRSLPRWRCGLPVPHLLLTELFEFAFCKSFAIAILVVYFSFSFCFSLQFLDRLAEVFCW